MLTWEFTLQKIFARLGVRRKGFHELDETLPTKRVLADVFRRSLGLVVVLVGLDEPDETPDELAADSVDMEPFEESGCKWGGKFFLAAINHEESICGYTFR